MATSTLTLTADSRLSEDYIQTSDILVPATSPNPVAPVLMNDGSTNALVVIQGQGLQQLLPATNSQSGWALTAIPSGANAIEVVGGTDSAGQMHAFFQDGSKTYHTSLGTSGGWATPDGFSPAANLGVTNVPLTNELVAFGVTPDGNLLLMRQDPTGQTWQGTTVDVQHALVGAQGVLKMVDAHNWLLAVNNGGKLQYYTGIDFSVASGPQTVATTNPVSRVHFAYQHLNSTMLLFSDAKNQLFTSVGFSDQVAQIPGAQVVQGAGVIGQDDGLIRFHGVDPTGALWILHQTGWDANQAPTWAPIFPLDNQVGAIAAPLAAQDGTALFAVGLDQTLHTLTQNPDTMLWSRLKAQMPGGAQPYYLSRFRTQINLFDQNQNPAANVKVTINADTAAAVLINNTTYFIGPDPDESATITTDTTGLLTITCAATALATTAYTISAPGMSSPQRVLPDQNYHDFLSGAAGINTGSAAIAPMSATTLKTATVNGKPLAPNLTDDLANVASQGIINAMQTVSNSPQLTAANSAGWALDLRDRQNPRFIQFQTHAELQAHRATLAASSESIGDQITQFFGDVWHAIKNGVMKVVHWVVDTVKKVVSLAVQIGEKIVQLGDMVIHGIEEAISVVHSIFNYIEAKIEAVIDWLKDLFSTGDIWATKQVFEHLFRTAIPALQYMIQQKAEVEVNSFFKGLKQTVDGGINAAASYLEGQSIGQMVSPNKDQLAARGHRLAAANGAPSGSPAQNNWLQSKVGENLGGSAFGPLSTGLPSNLADQLWSTLSNSGMLQDLQNALSDISQFFKDIWHDPRSLVTKGAADLVRAVGAFIDFVLDLMDTIITMILEIVSAALGSLDALLTQSLGDIPLVTWIYRHVFCPSGQEEDPTIIGLCSLLLALPVTIIYKLGHENNPPFTSDQVTQILNWQFQPPSQTRVAAAAMGAGAPAAGGGVPINANLQATLAAYLSLPQACADMAVDGLASADDSGSSTATKAAGWLDIVITGLMQVLTWPEHELFNFDWDWKKLTPAQILMRSTWIGGWVPLLVNGALLAIPFPSTGRVAEGVDGAGKTFLVVWGGLMFGLGLTGSIMGLAKDDPKTANGYNIATAILGPLPNLTQFLRYDKLVDATDGITLGVKLVVNDVADVATGFLQGKAI
jgi:hypothetical protein